MRMKNYRQYPDFMKLIGSGTLEELERMADASPSLPCPFCGGDPEVRLAITWREYVSLYIVCSSCGIQTARLQEGKTVTGNTHSLQDRLCEAVQVWNRRA